jgi:hypothetical protein
MFRRRVLMLVLELVLISLAGCSQPDTAGLKSRSADTAPGLDLTPLFSRVWQLTEAPTKPAPGSIYVFLPNGTLLETSCVETYRIAAWTIEKEAPSVLRVVEDQQLAFTAEIIELTDYSLRLRQHLVRSDENRILMLKGVEREFVCPDLRR